MVDGTLNIQGLIDELEKKIFDALDEAADETTILGVAYAKRLAPQRKVSYLDRNRQTRDLTKAEIRALPASVRAGILKAHNPARRGAGELSGIRLKTTVRRSVQSRPAPEVEEDERGVFRLKDPGDEKFLTYRGRQELAENGRYRGDEPVASRVNLATGKIETIHKPRTTAIYTRGFRAPNPSGRGQAITASRSTLGGRLRGEIRGEKLPVSKGKIVYQIVSPTPYARFVELPTSRTAAQPYLRPTLKYLRGPFKTRVFRSLKKRGFQIDPA